MKNSSLKSPFPRHVYHKNAEIYKILANPLRLEIMNTIKNREATVDDLSKMLGIRKANTSQHLTVLRHQKVVQVRRAGKNAFYKLVDPKIVAPCKVLKELWEK